MDRTVLFVVASLGAVAWLLFALRHPRPAVWAVLLWIPIQGWFQLNVFNDSNLTVLVYEVQILVLYLVFASKALKSPARFGPPALLYVAAPFVAWALLLVPYSIDANGLVLTLVGLRSYLLPLPLVWIGYRAFETRPQFEAIASLLMLQLIIVAAVTMIQFASFTTMSGTVFEVPVGYVATNVIRPPGTFSAPGHLGNYLLFTILFAIGLLGLRASYWQRVYAVIGLACSTLALMANTTRGVMVMLAVAVPLTVLLARQRQALAKLIVALCVIGAAGALIGDRVSGFALRTRVATISGDLHRTLILNPWDRMLDALESPMVGEGLGVASPGAGRLDAGPALRPRFQQDESLRWGESIKPGESFMAALVYETGVPGLIFFYAFIGAILYTGWRTVAACRANDARLLAAALLACEVVILLASWPYGPLRFPPLRVLFWFWAGVMLALPRLAVPVADTASVQRTARRMSAIMSQRRLPVERPAARRRAV